MFLLDLIGRWQTANLDEVLFESLQLDQRFLWILTSRCPEGHFELSHSRLRQRSRRCPKCGGARGRPPYIRSSMLQGAVDPDRPNNSQTASSRQKPAPTPLPAPPHE